MSKKYAAFLSALFCAFLGVIAAANLLTPDRDFSQVENRALAQRPTLTAGDLAPSMLLADKGDFYTGKFMADYETYITDQFVLRDAWVAAKAGTERLLGKKENNGVYFCSGGALITRFEQPDEARLSGNLSRVSALAQAVDVPVALALIPTQARIWAHRLPQNAPNYDQSLVLAAAQETPGVNVIDLFTVLDAHRDEDIFYRTDHHWTSLGAYYGYVGLARALGFTPVPLSDYEKTTVSTDFYGTVYSSSGVRWVEPDVIDVYVPESDAVTVTSYTFNSQGQQVGTPRQLYDESFLAVKDKYSMFLGGNQALGVVRTGHTDKPRLLILRDSYADSLVPFLTPHFSEIHLLDLRYYKMSTSEYVEENGIDQVLVLYSVPNFSTDANFPFLR